jgi:hypothetical protein
MAKKATKKAAGTRAAKATKTTARKATRSTAQRDLIRHGSRSAYAKRTPEGQFIELDDVGRSQAADRRVKAKRTVRSGYGDQGDQAPDVATGTNRTARKRPVKRTAKKR